MDVNMSLVWVAALVLFGILEAATVNLVSIWFMGGSLAAFVAALCHGPEWLQVTLFFVVSILLLACLRPFVRKYVNPRRIRTNVDSNIGKAAVVTETIDNLNAQGQIKVGGIYWTARSESGTVIPAGSTVTVSRIEGVKAIVALAEPVGAKK